MKRQAQKLIAASVLCLFSALAFGADWTNGTISLTWELAAPAVVAKGEEFTVTAACNYNPNMAAGKQWEYGSPSISFEWQANPDGTTSNQSSNGTGGSGGSFSYKSNITIKYDTASTEVGDKTVRVSAHVTGSITDYGPDEQKGTADDVTYTIDQWSDWLETHLTAFEIESVSVAKTNVAAGAIASEPHQASLTVTLRPRTAGARLELSLTGGLGFTGSASALGTTVSWHGPATLAVQGEVYRAGDAEAINGVSGQDGTISGVVTSSNRFAESAAVLARARSQSVSSAAIAFSVPQVEIEFLDPLVPGDEAIVRATLSLGESPLTGHRVILYVRNVKAGGEWVIEDETLWQTDAEAAKGAVEGYAWIVAGADQTTDEAGVVEAVVSVSGQLVPEEVRVQAIDVSVHH